MKKRFKFQKRQALIALAATVLFLGTITYAYFTNLANNDKNQLGALSTGTMSLRFADNDNGINASIKFGETITKKFIIENTGTLAASLSIDWYNLINTYMNGSLTYKLSYSKTENGEYTVIKDTTNVPVSDVMINQTLEDEVSVPAGETYYYNLDITLNNLPDADQSEDLDAIFTCMFNVGQPWQYRYYTLRVNPNGGIWNGFISTQKYQLRNKETMTIDNPTRVGYTFEGWRIFYPR